MKKKYLIYPLTLFCLQAFAQRKDLPTMDTVPVAIMPGPCKPTWKSLGDNFKVPGWFNKAKIGMWLHWGPQSIAGEGDWYAKWMYMPNFAWGPYKTVYKDHLERYGHPSIMGYKDMLPLWKAEKWNPAGLMALYKRAGARYVIAQGMHHDNFDLWNSKYQPWNAVKIGPNKDILGGWKKAADKEGMKFGIAFHGDYSWWWYQPAFLSDFDGPLKDIPYDAAQSYDGKDTWWKAMGLNLKDLYGIDLKNEVNLPPGSTDDIKTYRMRDPLSQGIPNGNLKYNLDFAKWYCEKWTNRVIDAIDQFSPDFIYFDGGGGSYPFCGFGTGRGYRSDATPRAIAHLYNSNIKKNKGVLQAMAFTKGDEDPRAVAFNYESRTPKDIERGKPWQTENGLGKWFYRAGTFYDSGMVIHEMLEAVARNGNYVINIPLTPQGELDPGGEKTLKDMGDWMAINGEGIYNSSAWDVWGEGSVVMERGNLNLKQAQTPYTAQDIRFTVNNGSLYAYLMAYPTDHKIVIRSVNLNSGKVTGVKLLGFKSKLKWKQTDNGLEVTLPASPPDKFAYGLKILGSDLRVAALVTVN